MSHKRMSESQSLRWYGIFKATDGIE